MLAKRFRKDITVYIYREIKTLTHTRHTLLLLDEEIEREGERMELFLKFYEVYGT